MIEEILNDIQYDIVSSERERLLSSEPEMDYVVKRTCRDKALFVAIKSLEWFKKGTPSWIENKAKHELNDIQKILQ